MSRTQVPNVELARDTARSNLLTNGGFEIWQRGNGPFTVNGVWSADRWQIGLSGSDALSVQRDTANADVGSTACALLNYVASGGTNTRLTTNGNAGGENSHLLNRTVTLSLRVKTSVANAYRPFIYSGSAYVYGAFHTGGGQYETLTLTTTLGTGAQAGACGVQVAANGSAYIDNAMLVIGSVAADYAPLHPADDLARCLRYYQILGESNSAVISGYGLASGAVYAHFPFAIEKAVTPTVTKNGTWATANASQPSLTTVTARGMTWSTTATATGSAIVTSSGAGQNISIEANP